MSVQLDNIPVLVAVNPSRCVRKHTWVICVAELERTVCDVKILLFTVLWSLVECCSGWTFMLHVTVGVWQWNRSCDSRSNSSSVVSPHRLVSCLRTPTSSVTSIMVTSHLFPCSLTPDWLISCMFVTFLLCCKLLSRSAVNKQILLFISSFGLTWAFHLNEMGMAVLPFLFWCQNESKPRSQIHIFFNLGLLFWYKITFM